MIFAYNIFWDQIRSKTVTLRVKGHLNLFEAGRQYILAIDWPSNIKPTFGDFYISPTHPTSLAKKHGKTKFEAFSSEDVRMKQIDDFLDKRTKLLDNNFVIDMNNDKLEATSKIISNIRTKVESKSSETILHRLVQISGTDSKVDAIIKNHKIEIYFKTNPYEKDWLKSINSFRLILIEDGRDVPKGNFF